MWGVVVTGDRELRSLSRHAARRFQIATLTLKELRGYPVWLCVQ